MPCGQRCLSDLEQCRALRLRVSALACPLSTSLYPTQWWALHGHLSAASIEGKRVGDTILRGELLGWLGEEHENGEAFHLCVICV